MVTGNINTFLVGLGLGWITLGLGLLLFIWARGLWQKRRYGDPVKYDGYLDGLSNIHKILKPGGKFYFSVPIGPQRIEFNAHRVFSVGYLLSLFEEGYRIDMFSYVDDNGDLHENAGLENKGEIETSFGCHYGCGIFEMTKR